MKRQLYYLLPDVGHTQQLCEDLQALNIHENSLTAVMQEKSEIKGIHAVHGVNETDRGFFLEWFLWRLNLTVFALAVLVFVGYVVWQPSYWIIVPLVVMAMTFVVGMYFSIRVPNVHWNEFCSAIRHGEIALIVDVPVSQVRQVDSVVHRRHPEAVNGGVCWKV